MLQSSSPAVVAALLAAAAGAVSTSAVAAQGAGLSFGAEFGASGADASAETSGAAADEGADQGVPRDEEDIERPTAEHGLRLGASLPLGESSSGRDLSDDAVVRLPVWVDIGFRPSRDLYLALFGQVGLGSAGDMCEQLLPLGDPSCAYEDWRVGFEALLSPLPPEEIGLWIGAGVGWEWKWQMSRAVVEIPNADGTTDSAPLTVTELDQGPMLELQGGIDFRALDLVRTGPFLSYTVGSFLHRELKCPSELVCTTSSDWLSDATVHHWLTVGMRGTFGL